MNRRALLTAALALIPAPLLAQWNGGRIWADRPYWPQPELYCRRWEASSMVRYKPEAWPASQLYKYRGEPWWGHEGDYFPGEVDAQWGRGRVALMPRSEGGRAICCRMDMDSFGIDHYDRWGYPVIMRADPRSAFDWVMSDPEN